ncbi:uncharacterized protein B0P05DRAFT_582861 [Gilbertella persicaria]|uniref:uncharacterized protein n=1 Tax=Gilbertella persicaria TaxID=101096 RepID=UPI0022207C1A|nr:uncharacterized protein B0P05DRAFT_582861 [Gilbertella persicaria]KAI8097876.1 hypothetical protein B0P05DRAFT_582861 [Gilbertella persicaria]
MSNNSNESNSRTASSTTNHMNMHSPYLMKFMSDPVDFTGDIKRINPINWIKKLDRIKSFGNLDDENIILIAVDHLVDQANSWFNLTHPDPETLTWKEFKTSFKAVVR